MAGPVWRLCHLRNGPLFLLLLLSLSRVNGAILLGGLTFLSQKEIATKEFAEIVQHSAQWYNTKSNKSNWHTFVGVSDATKQVVQGVKYRYKLHLRATDCVVQDALLNGTHQMACPLKRDSPLVICSASVWHRPWLNEDAKISEIEECWELTDLDLLLTEVQYTQRAGPTPHVLNGIRKSVDELNLQGLYTHVYRYSSYTEGPRSKPIVVLNETACGSTTDVEELEQLKLTDCYNKTSGKTITCALGQNRVNCGPVLTKPVSFMWRGTASEDLKSAQKEVTSGSWIKQPLFFDGQMYTQLVPKDLGNTTEFVWMVNKSAELYRRNVNTLYTLNVTNASATEEEKPFILCSTYVTPNKTHYEKCEPVPPRPKLRSTAALVNVAETNQKIDEFHQLLRRIANAFLTNVFPGSNFTVLHVSKQSPTKMMVWFGECDFPTQLPCLESALPPRKIRKKYIQCNIDTSHRGNKSEQIKLTNCWHSDVLALFEPIIGKWNKLSPANIRGPEVDEVIEEAVKEYLLQTNTNLSLDHVSDFFQMADGGKKSSHFVLHFKARNHSRTHHTSHKSSRQRKHHERSPADAPQISVSRQILHQCNVVYRPWKDEKKVTLYNCRQREQTEVRRLGAPRRMKREELHGVEFDRILRHAHEVYNSKLKPENAHRLHGYKDAEVQVVAGIMTKFKAYYVETACKRMPEGHYFKMADAYECETENTTHITVCQVVVWKKSWLEKYEKYKFLDCQTLPRNITLLNDVRIIPSGHHLRPAFAKIISTAANLVNENLKNFTHYFQVQQVTKPEYEDALRSSLQFKMFMRSSDFEKGVHDTQYFENQDSPHYSNLSREILICEVAIKADHINREDLNLTIPVCVLVNRLNQSQGVPRHPAKLSEVDNPEFRESVQQATGLFNRAFGSSLLYGRPEVENVVVEDMAGRLTTFQLHMFPDSCANPVLTGRRCEALASSAVVTCSVRVWHQPWSANHRLVHVGKCIRYQKPTSEEDDKTDDHQRDITAIAVPKMVKLFSKATDSSTGFSKVVSENVADEGIAGRWTKFELFLAPNQSTCTNECGDSGNSKYFYHCRAVAWLRPWLNDNELLQLSHCKMIRHQPMSKSTADTKESTSAGRMKYIMDKAVELYNQQLSGDHIYGLPEQSDVEIETTFGRKTQFNMQMEAIACRLSETSTDCKDDNVQSQPSIHCQVTHQERPWDSSSEAVSLRNCRKVYGIVGVAGDTGTQALTKIERDSDEFQRSLKALLQLYRPPVPIIYEIKSVQNANVKSGEARNITFEMVLQPIGCDNTQPNAADKSCQHWMYQDSIQCSAKISDSLQPNSPRNLYLMNCRTLWRIEAKRQLTEDERMSSWFQDSVKTSSKMHRKMFTLEQYFKVLSIEEAYIQRTTEEVVTYKLKLIETTCPMPVYEEDFPYLQLEGCDLASTTGYNCDVTLTKQPNSSANQQVKCASSENVLLD